MKLEEIINKKFLDAASLKNIYQTAKPFPHIILTDFLDKNLLKKVLNEFPDLSKEEKFVNKFNDPKEIKLASEGSNLLSPSAVFMNSYLQSDSMLKWLNILTGINEPLISDPYLRGAGYHELKKGGLLKVHIDFNKHTFLNLNRRLNLLIYLNEDWNEQWGGTLELYDHKNMSRPIQTIYPHFNTAVIFSTTSTSYHGNPDPVKCPEERSRKSFAYYYYSTENIQDTFLDKHSTLFKERTGEKFKKKILLKEIIRDFVPPVLVRVIKSLTSSHKK